MGIDRMADPPPQEGTEATRPSAAALYTFLKEFTQLRTTTVRSLDQYDHVLWFSDVPREPGCDCAAWHRGQDREGGEVWLEVRQPRLIPQPEPPGLIPWLIPGQVAWRTAGRERIGRALSASWLRSAEPARRPVDSIRARSAWNVAARRSAGG